MVKNYTATLLAVLWLCVIKAKVSTSIEVTISPRCFGRISSCLTLSTVPTATNLTLTFQPGEHIISSSIVSFQHKQSLELKGSGRASIVCTTTMRRYNPNIRLSQNSKVTISGLTFSGCNIQFIRTNNTALHKTNFIDNTASSHGRVIEFSNSYNVTIEKSNFNNNAASSHGSVIEFSNSYNVTIDKSKFNNNTAASHGSVIEFSNSYNVTIDKSKFNNNAASYHGRVIEFSNSYNVTIDKSNFNNNTAASHGRVIEFSNSYNVTIDKSNFNNNTAASHGSVIEFSNSYNVTIDKSNFNDNTASSHGGVIEFSNTKGIEFTRSNFSNNRVSFFSGVIRFLSSIGSIGCTNFHNNSANSYGGVVTLASGSALYVSNSTFKNSTLSSYGGVIHLDSTNDNVIVVSSVFMDSLIGSRGGVINLDAAKSSATLISSKFISTWRYRRYSSIGSAVYSDSTDVIIDCCEFINSTVPIQFVHYDTGLCGNYNLDDPATCEDTTCNLKDCSTPKVTLSLEQLEYTVTEGIGKSFRALQICAVTTDLQFGIQASLQIHNGSATEIEDFVIGSPDCRLLKFKRRVGTQKECTYIRIVEDSVKEGNEQFSVSLSSFYPQVVFDIQKATITITEDDAPTADPTPATVKPKDDTSTAAPIPATEIPATEIPATEIPATEKRILGLSKTALVECGPLRRPVTYSSGGNDLDNLKTAIVQSYRGLTGILAGHISLLQIKSDKYGDYIDALSSSMVIKDNSLVRVITYDSFSCQPRYIPK